MFLAREETQRSDSFGMQGGRKRSCPGSWECHVCRDLLIFLAQCLIIKPSSIIELCVQRSRDSGSLIAQGCDSINLSLPVSFAEISKWGPPDGAASLLELVKFYDSHMSKKRIVSWSFDVWESMVMWACPLRFYKRDKTNTFWLRITIFYYYYLINNLLGLCDHTKSTKCI